MTEKTIIETSKITLSIKKLYVTLCPFATISRQHFGISLKSNILYNGL